MSKEEFEKTFKQLMFCSRTDLIKIVFELQLRINQLSEYLTTDDFSEHFQYDSDKTNVKLDIQSILSVEKVE